MVKETASFYRLNCNRNIFLILSYNTLKIQKQMKILVGIQPVNRTLQYLHCIPGIVNTSR